MEFKKSLPVKESMRRMKEDGVARIILSYKDAMLGRNVLVYNNGRFTRLLTIANNPKLTVVKEIPYDEGIHALKKIVNGSYRLEYASLMFDKSHPKAERGVV